VLTAHPRCQRLNLKCHEVLATVAFSFNTRRYTPVLPDKSDTCARLLAAAHAKAGRRRLTLSNPR